MTDFSVSIADFVAVSGSSGGSLGLFRNREFLALASTAFARSQAYSTILIALALYADQFGTTGAVGDSSVRRSLSSNY